MEDYKKMLDEAYASLPERVKSRPRFEAPSFDILPQGNQTVITNFMEVVKKLRREPKILMKYMTKELGVPANVVGDRLILKGRVRYDKINKKLKNFIDTYVLCRECGRPDTDLVTIEGVLYIRCSACGARYPVPPIA